MKKQIIIISFAVLLVVALSMFTRAEFWACFNKGEVVHYCNNYKPDKTCKDNGGCAFCMSVHKEEDCYIHGVWPKCMKIPQECSNIEGNTTIDSEPPDLTINNPKQNSLYTSRSILLDFILDEEADVYYIDNINGRGRWIRVCQGCYSYSNARRFNEGFNNITFKAVDVVGNEIFVERSFFIDSKKPKIKKTLPKNGFANGFFEVEIQEENPSSLVLHYGNLIKGYREKNISLNDCESIKGNSDKFYCTAEVNLQDYSGQQIEYWFGLEDIAGNKDESKAVRLEVDTKLPAINSINYTISKREVAFSINITEENFNEVVYYDHNDRRPRWIKLCSKLKNGICEKRKTFRKGDHIVDIQVTDEAGNAVSERIEFDITY